MLVNFLEPSLDEMPRHGPLEVRLRTAEIVSRDEIISFPLSFRGDFVGHSVSAFCGLMLNFLPDWVFKSERTTVKYV